MQIFSEELERELLQTIENYIDKRLELERQELDNWDLIPRKVLMEKLNISPVTMLEWEKKGLKQYQPPFESSKKVYYRKSDVYIFLGIER